MTIRKLSQRRLARECPPSLGREIILTGSVARGVADDFSDIEQVFYVDVLPTPDERETWLKRIGATQIRHDTDPIEDGSFWSTFFFQGVWVEAGWQTLHAQKQNLHAILAGEVLEHHKLTLAEIMVHALLLRGERLLAQWQEQLAHYPATLAQKLISSATELWRADSRAVLCAQRLQLAFDDTGREYAHGFQFP